MAFLRTTFVILALACFSNLFAQKKDELSKLCDAEQHRIDMLDDKNDTSAGYQNISRVLENASDAQIVSSKQIGTWTVNNELLKDMCEMMRTGTGEIVWSTL
ncbi:MAG: hypothetical protein FJY15_08850, partial [Bacteroidetes bacterium]|nr:hypothetical protein [Bacteroidota bacterium]